MNPLLLSALISAVVGFGGAWTWQGYRMDSYKLEVVNEKLAIEQSNARQLSEAQAKITDAQAAARLATDRFNRDAAGANTASGGLRNALAASVRAAHADLQACTRQVDALSELFTASTTAYRELAKEADGWVGQAVTLQDGWPGAGKGAATGQTSPTAGQTN